MNHRLWLHWRLPRPVWVQAIGRGLYQAGFGLIQFYTPLVFVNQVGLSATAVGIGIGSSSLSGAVGNFLGGALADSQRFGRRGTLLFSAGLAALSSLILTLACNLLLLVGANLLLGLSMGFYWTAADVSVMDITTPEQRHEAFAILGLADNLGMGIGVLGGGALLTSVDQARALFIVGGCVFLAFLMLIQTAIAETRQNTPEHPDMGSGWMVALNDQCLRIYVLVNILFTTYIALVTSTLPLYFTNFMSTRVLGATATVRTSDIASLFTWAYIGLGFILQVPLAQALSAFSHVCSLMISMLLWGFGFFLVWIIGGLADVQLTHEIGVLAVLAIATVIYKPFASAFLAKLAPESWRGAYTAIGYQCWAIGYLIGPLLGGWAMDQPPVIAHQAWIFVALSTLCGLIILQFLNQRQVSDNAAVLTEEPT
jgi:MFS family permease